MTEQDKEPVILDAVDAAFALVRSVSKNPPRLNRPAKKMRTEHPVSAKDVILPGITDRPRGQVHKSGGIQPADEPGQGSDKTPADKTLGTGHSQEEGDPGIAALRAYMENYKLTQEFRTKTARPTDAGGHKPRRKLAVPSLGQAVGRHIRDQGWEHDLANGWIMSNWSKLVGEGIAAHTEPIKIEGHVVFVQCDNSNWATQLRYAQRTILQKIAEKIGPNIITELRIHGPKQHRNYKGRMWVKPQGSKDTYG